MEHPRCHPYISQRLLRYALWGDYTKTKRRSWSAVTQLVPLDKRSKKARREYHAKQRGSWHGVNPITRTVQNRKTYDRARVKQADRRDLGIY